jgi:hypothetical protein
MNLLLVGLDSRTDNQGNPLPQQVLAALHAGGNEGELNADTLILVHIPAGAAQLTMAVSIPGGPRQLLRSESPGWATDGLRRGGVGIRAPTSRPTLRQLAVSMAAGRSSARNLPAANRSWAERLRPTP